MPISDAMMLGLIADRAITYDPTAGIFTFLAPVATQARPTFNGNTPWDTGNYLDTRGNCQLNYVSGTGLVLTPCNGTTMVVNGKLVTIPTAGVTLANSAAATASTLYYIYAVTSDNATVTSLEASTTTFVQDAATGTKVKSGDSTRALVGAWYCTTASSFAPSSSTDSNGASYYNRVTRVISTGYSGTFAEAGATLHSATFFCWGDEAISSLTGGYLYTANSGNTSTFIHRLDGNVFGQNVAVAMSTASYSQSIALVRGFTATLGYHTLTISGSNDGQNVNYYASQSVTIGK